MARIYFINVGANTSHSGKARSPIFPDSKWIYVSFPKKKNEQGEDYPREARSYVSVGIRKNGIKTHLDPDWKGLTYGDCCSNARAAALKQVEPGDILLFWALLWKTCSCGECVFGSRDKGWYLIGALQIKQIFKGREKITSPRARSNAHAWKGRVEGRNGRKDARVFVGSQQHSCRFTKAVDLEVGNNNGLMRQLVKTKDEKQIQWDRPPRWNSVTRACRAILDLDKPDDRKVAKELAKRIRSKNKGFDLLRGID